METSTAQWLDSITASVRATTLNLAPRKAFQDRFFDPSSSLASEKPSEQVSELLLSVQSLKAITAHRLDEAFRKTAPHLQTAGVLLARLEERSASSSATAPALQEVEEQTFPEFATRTHFDAAFADLRSLFERNAEHAAQTLIISDEKGAHHLADLHTLAQDFSSAPSRALVHTLRTDILAQVTDKFTRTRFIQAISDFREDCRLKVDKSTGQLGDSFKAHVRDGKLRLQEQIDVLASQTAALQSQLTSERSRLSVEAVEERIATAHLENAARTAARLRSRVEMRQQNTVSPRFRDLKERVEKLEALLRGRTRASDFAARKQALMQRLEVLEQDIITNDSRVELSAGEVQLEAAETGSGFMMISIHDLGDSDLESQGYISPHLSPMNALLPFRFPQNSVSPKTTSLIKVEDFVQELADALIASETQTAFKLLERAIGDHGVRHMTTSIIPRSTLQYSEDNGETFEDEIDLYSDLEEESGEASPTFPKEDSSFLEDVDLP